jgi:hypothetical protein
MNRVLECQPDLEECVLEDRTLPAVIVPGLPWLEVINNASAVFVVPGQGGPGTVSNNVALPGPTIAILSSVAAIGVGGGVYGIGTPGGLFAFYPNGYGFNGTPPVSFGSALGSGASAPGGGGATAQAGGSVGYGATVSSGFNTSLNAQNNFGQGPSTSAIGQTTSGSDTPATTTPASNDAPAPAPPPPQINSNPNPAMLGVNPSARDNLLQGVITNPPALGVTGK